MSRAFALAELDKAELDFRVWTPEFARAELAIDIKAPPEIAAYTGVMNVKLIAITEKIEIVAKIFVFTIFDFCFGFKRCFPRLFY